MRKIDLDELRQMAKDSYDSLYSAANSVGRGIKIYLHWSAGHYGQFFEDYHINIDRDGSIYASTDNLSEVLAHTYHRNTGAVGVSLACCAGATSNDLGDEPPTEAAIDAMAKVIAVLCDEFGLEITKDNVMTHGEAANNEDGFYAHEPYATWSDPAPSDGVTRWDLEFLGTDESPAYDPFNTDGSRGGDVLRGKAIWWQQQGV